MAGGYELRDKIAALAGIDLHHSVEGSGSTGHHDPVTVSADGKFSIEFVECLASCGTGPVCMVNDDFHEAVSDEKAQHLIECCK
jgi:NADH-quinone oxidoreductase subunit E